MNTTESTAIATPAARSIKDFCADYGMSRATFYALLSSGTAPRVLKLGRGMRITRAAEQAWLAEREAAAIAEAPKASTAGRMAVQNRTYKPTGTPATVRG